MKVIILVKINTISLWLLLFLSCSQNERNSKKLVIPSRVVVEISEKQDMEFYRHEIERAIAILSKEKKIIDSELDKKEQIEILSIGFPEVIRYNAFSDLIETTSNRLLYINGGEKASDFSVGLFQMRPSFIQDLENYVASTSNLKEYNFIEIQEKTDKEVRKERVRRLENFRWQLRYLKVFWAVMHHKYGYLVFENKLDRLRFYATAYNYGFNRPLNEIVLFQFKKKFPYGNSNNKPMRFADFSIDFLNHKSIINP